MKRLLAAILLLALVACEAGRDAANEAAAPRALQQGLVDPERIDATLRGFVERGELVGVSALVYEDGSEAYFGAFGMADRELDRRMQRDTLVQIFSMTKPLTGVTLMTLYEQGLFALDDPLHDYLPEFSGIRVYQGGDGDELRHAEPQRPPTIRDILRHTAGFANGERGDAPWVTRRYRETDPGRIQNTLQQMSERLASVPLAFEPGTRWSYGPSADVQARLVEVLSEQPFQDMMHARVLTPLAMHDTQYTLSYEQLGRMSALYERKPDGSFERFGDDALNFNLYDWPMKPGSWGLTSTLDDYMRFARMLLNEGELDGIRILEPATVRLMSTDALPAGITDKSWLPNKGQVGFGIDFAVRMAPPADQAEASGAVGEFFWDGAANTLFWIDPENDIAAVLFNIYRPWGQVTVQKDFRDAIYHSDATATALNKSPPGPDSRRLSD